MYCLITPTTFDQKVRSLPTFSFYTLRIQKLSLFLVHHQHLPPSPIQSTKSPNDHPTLQRYICFQHANKAALELSQLNKVMPKLSLKSNHSHLMLFHHLSHSLPTTPLLNESYLIKVLPSNLIYVTSWSKPVQVPQFPKNPLIISTQCMLALKNGVLMAILDIKYKFTLVIFTLG